MHSLALRAGINPEEGLVGFGRRFGGWFACVPFGRWFFLTPNPLSKMERGRGEEICGLLASAAARPFPVKNYRNFHKAVPFPAWAGNMFGAICPLRVLMFGISLPIDIGIEMTDKWLVIKEKEGGFAALFFLLSLRKVPVISNAVRNPAVV